MINKSVDKAVVDAVLEKAFADAFEREMAETSRVSLSKMLHSTNASQSRFSSKSFVSQKLSCKNLRS